MMSESGPSKRMKHDFLGSLCDWIRSRGGYVHPSIQISASRELHIDERIEEATLLCRIPWKCVVTVPRICQMDESFQRFYNSLDKNGTNLSTRDLLLAIYLATQPKDIEPYTNTLPHSSAFDALPRRWSEDKLELIQGSPLLQRIRQLKDNIELDYKQIKKVWSELEMKGPCPNFEAFSDALAVVTSRAFEAPVGFHKSSTNETTLIPMLDLCNHHRGGIAASKNMSYSFDSDNVIVKAVVRIEKGDTLRITYGAQSNAQLLLNYGFCLLNNLEPDGSSNDTLEFYATPNSKTPIFLRAGPKSYSYGCFVSAVESFLHQKSEEGQSLPRRPDEDDLQAFLDECEEQEDDEECPTFGQDIYRIESSFDGQQEEEDLNEELQAIKSFKARLLEIKASYKLTGTELANRMGPADERYYAAIFIHSELRTIYFFLRVASILESHFEGLDQQAELIKLFEPNDIDTDKIEAQVRELVSAYMQIRHPDRSGYRYSL